MSTRYVPNFMGQHADDLAGSLGLHQETGMNEYSLAAGHEGIEAAVVDYMDRNGAWIEARGLEEWRYVDANGIFDFRIADKAKPALRECLWRVSDGGATDGHAKNEKTHTVQGDETPFEKDCSDAYPPVQSRYRHRDCAVATCRLQRI